MLIFSVAFRFDRMICIEYPATWESMPACWKRRRALWEGGGLSRRSAMAVVNTVGQVKWNAAPADLVAPRCDSPPLSTGSRYSPTHRTRRRDSTAHWIAKPTQTFKSGSFKRITAFSAGW